MNGAIRNPQPRRVTGYLESNGRLVAILEPSPTTPEEDAYWQQEFISAMADILEEQILERKQRGDKP